MHNLHRLLGIAANNVGKDVGIEIEVEGERLPRELVKFWKAEHDGSLRGESMEYVLARPVAKDKVNAALTYLYDSFKANNSTIYDTGRAGIHVHVNVSHLPTVKIFNIVALYFIFESLFVQYCGKNRVGNHFCLRATDAEGLIDHIVYALNKQPERLVNDQIRYASINLKSLGQYGSLEFRSMKSPATQEEIETWVNMLLHLREVALQYDDPVQIYTEYSMGGVEELAHKALGPYHKLLTGLDKGWKEATEASVRVCQDLVFRVNWDKFKEEHKNVDVMWEDYVPQLAPAPALGLENGQLEFVKAVQRCKREIEAMRNPAAEIPVPKPRPRKPKLNQDF